MKKELRRLAQEQLKKKGQVDPELMNKDLASLVEELSIYQIELEHQNEELILSQAELQKSKDKYIDLFNNAPTAYIIVDKDHKIQNINNTACKLLGTDYEKIVGSLFSNWICREYQDKFYLYFKEIQKNYVKSSVDIKLKPEGLNNFYARLIFYTDKFQNPDSELIRIAFIDVNTEKELENRLLKETEKAKENEHKFRQIVERSHDIFYYQNINTGRFEYVSPKITEILGYKPEEFMTWDVEKQKKQIHPDDIGSLNSFVDDLIAADEMGKSYIEREFRIMHKNGGYKWIEGSYNLIKNDDGKPHLICASLHDISLRKSTETDLINAKNKAEESDRLKSSFLANMSHEIRTPMNGILGFADLLKETKIGTDKQQKYIRIIEESGKRMLAIINDLISISKIESGEMNVHLNEVDINKILNYSLNFFMPEAREKGLTLSLNHKLPHFNSTVITDEEKLGAVLSNLLKNAIKYTHSGGISFGCRQKENVLEFYVIDTGIGIDEDKHKAVFERFVQADLSISKPYEGVGLGLAISSAYIKMLNGDIWIKSRKNEGSEFYFSIPLKQAYGKEDLDEKMPSKDFNESIIRDLSILIAEDEESADLYLTEVLEGKCRRLIHVSNGKEAVNCVKNDQDIDIILMDIKMPLMDGYSATNEIRKFNTDITIIAQTAYALEGDREKVLNGGFNDYIAKPIKANELLQVISKYVRS